MSRKPDFDMRLRVLNAVYDAPGDTIRARIMNAAGKDFIDARTGQPHRFTWRTISTWLYRHKKHGITTLENKTRADKDGYRKVQVNQLAEAINEVLPTLARNKQDQCLLHPFTTFRMPGRSARKDRPGALRPPAARQLCRLLRRPAHGAGLAGRLARQRAPAHAGSRP